MISKRKRVIGDVMVLGSEIRLIIVLPTLLFFIGFIFKAVVEQKNINKLVKKKENKEFCQDSLRDFFFILAIDSTFLFIANGLILMFQLEKNVFGITTMIVGVILSMFLLTGLHSRSKIGLIGNFGVFVLLTGELAYFLSYGIVISHISLENILFGAGALLGLYLGRYMSLLAFPLKLQNISEAEAVDAH